MKLPNLDLPRFALGGLLALSMAQPALAQGAANKASKSNELTQTTALREKQLLLEGPAFTIAV